METSPVPAGVKYELSHEIDSAGVEQFLIAHVQTLEGPMLWLARTIVPRHRGRIVDVVPLDSAARWELLSDDCRYRSPSTASSVTSADLFGLVPDYTSDSLGPVRLAWHVDHRSGKLVSVPGATVGCALSLQGA
jgi:hypothetical protein